MNVNHPGYVYHMSWYQLPEQTAKTVSHDTRVHETMNN